MRKWPSPKHSGMAQMSKASLVFTVLRSWVLFSAFAVFLPLLGAAQKGDLCDMPYSGMIRPKTVPKMQNLGASRIPELSVENMYSLCLLSSLDWRLNIANWSGSDRAPEYESSTFRFDHHYIEGSILNGVRSHYVIHWKPSEVPGYEMVWEDAERLNSFEKSLRRYYCGLSQKGGAVYRMLIDEAVFQLEFRVSQGNHRVITHVFR